jgi:hypothetical protein
MKPLPLRCQAPTNKKRIKSEYKFALYSSHLVASTIILSKGKAEREMH